MRKSKIKKKKEHPIIDWIIWVCLGSEWHLHKNPKRKEREKDPIRDEYLAASGGKRNMGD